MIKICILGAGGRMGGALIRGIAGGTALKLVAAVERAGHPAVGQDAGTVFGVSPMGIPVSTERAAGIAQAEVVIDFTFHTEVPGALAEAVKAKAAYVLGTTGLDATEIVAVETAAKEIPIVWASNFSLGVNILLDLVRRAAEALDASYDAEIVEMHHRHKKDAPSGTALALGTALAAGRKVDLQKVALYGREGITGERERGAIAFHAMRGGDVVGDHTVVFAADGERVELTHKASSRDCLSGGALRAAAWVAHKGAGLYSMADVLRKEG